MILTVPWEFVMHDNHRLMPIKMGKFARLAIAPKYRDAKAEATKCLIGQWKRTPPLAGYLQITGWVYMPDRRKRDAGNYRKLLTDALSGIAYTDDSQLIREVWELAGYVPKEQARVELLVEQIRPSFTTQGTLL